MIQYPISWEEQGSCGCIMYVTAYGHGFTHRTDYCDYHKKELERFQNTETQEGQP